MVLDGYEVKNGVRVYDLLNGYGEVGLVSPSSYIVKFGPLKLTVLGNGLIAGKKRIFWDNPIIYTPAPLDATGPMVRDILAAVLPYSVGGQ